MASVQDQASVVSTEDYSPTPTICFPSYKEAKDNLSLSSFTILPENGSEKQTSIPITTTEWNTKACLTTLGAFLSLFCTFGQMNSFGAFQTWYTTHQLSLYPQSAISWIGSMQLCVFFISGWPIGVLFDSFGPRPLLVAGSILHMASLAVTSFAGQFWHFVLGQGLLSGLGVGLMFYPSLSACSTHFGKYRATALGIASAGSGIGGVFYPIILRKLFPIVGFSWAILYAGIISLVFCSVAILTVSTRKSEKDASPRPWQGFQWITVSDTPFVLLTIGCSLAATALFIPYFYLANYAESINVASALTFEIISVVNAGSVVGRAMGFLADRVGRFNLFAPCIFLCGLSCLVIWMLAKTAAVVILFACVYGFASGAFIALITPCVTQISKSEETGSRIGALYTLVAFPSLCGGPMAGALLVACHGSHVGMISVTGSVLVLGAIFVVWAKLTIVPQFFSVV